MANTDYDFDVQRDDLIRRAYRIAGALPTGQQLSAEQTVNGKKALNSVVKHWQSKGVFLWTLKLIEFSTTAADKDYVLSVDPRVLVIDRAWYRSGDIDHPIEIKSFSGYQEISDKASVGFPQSVAIDYNFSPTLYVYPTPDDIYAMRLLAVTALPDLDTATSVPQIPQKFLEALTYALAETLAYETRLQIEERKLLFTKADSLFKEAYKSDRENDDFNVLESLYG